MAATANLVSAHIRRDQPTPALAGGGEARLLRDSSHQIGSRLAELDREWDIERTLEANASALALTGTVLAATMDRRWLALPAIVTGILFQHAVQG